VTQPEEMAMLSAAKRPHICWLESVLLLGSVYYNLPNLFPGTFCPRLQGTSVFGFDPQERSRIILRNVDTCLPNNPVSHAANSVIRTKETLQLMPSKLQAFFTYFEVIHFVHFT